MVKLSIKRRKTRDKEVKEETKYEKNAEQLLIYIPNGYEFFGISDDNKIILVKNLHNFSIL